MFKQHIEGFVVEEGLELSGWWKAKLSTLHEIAISIKSVDSDPLRNDVGEARRHINEPQFLRRLEEVECAEERETLLWQQYAKRASLLSAVLRFYQARANIKFDRRCALGLIGEVMVNLDDFTPYARSEIMVDCVKLLELCERDRQDPTEILKHLDGLNGVPRDIFYDAMKAIYLDQFRDKPSVELYSDVCKLFFIEKADGSEIELDLESAYLEAAAASEETGQAVLEFTMAKGGVNSRQYAKRLEEASLAKNVERFDAITNRRKVAQGIYYCAAFQLSDALHRLSKSVEELEALLPKAFDAQTPLEKNAQHVRMNNLVVAAMQLTKWRSQLEEAQRWHADITDAKSRFDPLQHIQELMG